MAEEAPPKPYDIKDLTQCSICLLELQQPKALPCLHSFCLKCLSQWTQEKDKVTCPLCAQEFEIPSGGVSSFRTNFVINTLIERQKCLKTIQSKDRVAPCGNCEQLVSNIEGHCNGCKGFICGDCVAIHSKIKHLKDHKIIPYVDLESGKVKIENIDQRKHCKVHEEQVLRFYCETCEGLICRDCTVVDHPATSHSLVNLDSVTKGQKTEIDKLEKNCNEVRNKIDGSLEELDAFSEMLLKSTTKAEADIDEAFHNAVKILENNRNKLKGELKAVVSERKKQISTEKDSIQLEQARLVTTLQVANEVLQTGSDYDLALVYSSLKTNLTSLCDLKPTRTNKGFGNVIFKQTPTSQLSLDDIGLILSSSRLVKGGGGWTRHEFQTMKARGRSSIAITNQNDIAILSIYRGEEESPMSVIKLYTTNGTLKSSTSIDGYSDVIKVSNDGRVFVTNGNHVNVYSDEMNLKQQFRTKSTDGVSSDIQDTSLRGLAIDNQNKILVGEVVQKYISKHFLDGTHVRSFETTIEPQFISVSAQDKIIVGSCYRKVVLILDDHGNRLNIVNHPPGFHEPYDVCCTSDDDLYILYLCSRYDGTIAINSSESGDYIGYFTNWVNRPSALALNHKEDTLVIYEENNTQNKVKVFKQK